MVFPGSLLSRTEGSDAITYAYDELGRMIRETAGGYTKEYAYNIGNLRTGFTVKQGNTVLLDNGYTYDALGRLTQVNGSGVTANYSYEDNSNLSSVAYNNGVTQSYTYNAGNLVAQAASAKGTNTLSRYQYTYDLSGRQTGLTDLSNRVTTYQYDPLGRLLSESRTAGGGAAYSKVYTYDSRGNRTSMLYNGFSQTLYTYDLANRLTLTDEDGMYSFFYYDHNGNLTVKEPEHIVPVSLNEEPPVQSRYYQYDTGYYIYNEANQVTSSQFSYPSAEYTYYADGLRKSKTIDDMSTVYVWDGDQLVLEITGGTVRKYIRGLTLAACVTGNAPVYYQYDGHGSVVQLTDAAGAVIKNYDYDAFGNELVWNYGDANPFRYSGEYFDDETDLYYLRARYYWPSLGQFTQQDPHWNPGNMVYGDSPTALSRGLVNTSSECYLPSPMSMMQSGNLYVYCAGNPVMYRDSSGEFVNAILGGVIGSVSGALGAFLMGKNAKNGAIAGALSGAIAGLSLDIGLIVASGTGGLGLGGGIAITAAGSAFGSFMGSVTEQMLNGTSINNLNIKSALKSAGVSGGFSLVSFGLGTLVNDAFELSASGATVMNQLVDSLRVAGMADTAISAFLSTVFVEMPRWMADVIVNI